jgi:hypothetical protein
MYLQSADPGMNQGGTVTGHETAPSIEAYENIFGPVARDIKLDSQRHKRHQRWHLPDALKGANSFLTDRIDGLITDATNSPFTRNILPYTYMENPDQKIKWNVYSFDEGIASRVPYEAAARVLPQSKRSFAGYVVRQGLAIAMEHNFMMSAKGQENFRNQLMQLVGSIQLTNDLDVHIALLTAPSYQKQQNEKYMDSGKTVTQLCRKYIDCFGIMQKIPNALDFLIEDAKTHLKTWGSQPPTFCLCNPALQTQLTMLPEKTNYVTNGPDGLKRLAQGPDLPSYRGLSFINTRKFSMEVGAAPRDLLRRRVRVGEYYFCQGLDWAPAPPGGGPAPQYPRREVAARARSNSAPADENCFLLYDQSRDDMVSLCLSDLLEMSQSDPLCADDDQRFDVIARIWTEFVTIASEQEVIRAIGAFCIHMDTTYPGAFPGGFALDLEAIYGVIAPWNGGGTAADPITTIIQTWNHYMRNHTTVDRVFTRLGPGVFPAAMNTNYLVLQAFVDHVFGDDFFGLHAVAGGGPRNYNRAAEPPEFLILRPNIEHEMLAVMFGRGGTQELGATFWGQTELSCYDDAQHGIWGMSYKYHERALVTNEKNLVRVYDVAFDGYNGGNDTTFLDWMDEDAIARFRECTLDKSVPYTGASMLVMRLPRRGGKNALSNPLIFSSEAGSATETGENARDLNDYMWNGANQNLSLQQKVVLNLYWKKLNINHWNPLKMRGKLPGECAVAGDTGHNCMAFQGTLKRQHAANNAVTTVSAGSGHLGVSFPGVASIREGRGMLFTMHEKPQMMHMI